MNTRRRSRPRGPILRAAAAVLRGGLRLAPVLLVLWSFGAVYYDFPYAPRWVAALFLLGLGAILLRLKRPQARLMAAAAAVGVVFLWWSMLRPSNDRPWAQDAARTAWAVTDGDTVTLHNVRRGGPGGTPVWETRAVRLSQITGIDLAIHRADSFLLAHPVASFQFADTPPVCFSIGPRLEEGETYSATRGFFRRYELIHTVTDERGAFAPRAGAAGDEDVFLYRMNITPDQARGRFVEYLAALNEIRDQPRWHNTAVSGWAAGIRVQHNGSQRTPWDWRLLVPGKSDELLFSRGRLITDGLSFQELKARARINDALSQAGGSPDFSRLIRAGRPGFGNMTVPAPAPIPVPAPAASPPPAEVPGPAADPEPVPSSASPPEILPSTAPGPPPLPTSESATPGVNPE